MQSTRRGARSRQRCREGAPTNTPCGPALPLCTRCSRCQPPASFRPPPWPQQYRKKWQDLDLGPYMLRPTATGAPPSRASLAAVALPLCNLSQHSRALAAGITVRWVSRDAMPDCLTLGSPRELLCVAGAQHSAAVPLHAVLRRPNPDRLLRTTPVGPPACSCPVRPSPAARLPRPQATARS